MVVVAGLMALWIYNVTVSPGGRFICYGLQPHISLFNVQESADKHFAMLITQLCLVTIQSGEETVSRIFVGGCFQILNRSFFGDFTAV